MTPAPGERLVRFVGDQLSFRLLSGDDRPLPAGWKARLRTNLGRGQVVRQESMRAHSGNQKLALASWRDLPMLPESEDEWTLSLSLTEPGFFKAKAYAIDARGRQHWPEGTDFGVSVHPDAYRTANTIYCAFPRQFGPTKTLVTTTDPRLDEQLAALDAKKFTVIPPSGKLRDLIAELPFITRELGCRILHLLPVTPTPTTYARFGRFGSPYAVQDLLAIDPALVTFDKRTTGVDQFRELATATHAHGAKLFLDVVINHTGWGATLQEQHPDWYLRNPDGTFLSPGAWGVVWEDLAELDHRSPGLWEYMADVFIEWCRRGVDGFRCDAGYKIPVPAWRYITARVQEEFPEAIFLLEGLGGSWEATENLLTDGGMQWAYSELFQNYSRADISGYLDYAIQQSRRAGLYIHYSETHDNDRLARIGREWSLLRNRLCALTSVSGGFGFTCGVEWLATEKVNVHSSRGLAWGQEPNIVPELAQLNRLLAEHPCFFDNAVLVRLSGPDEPVFAMRRVSAEGLDQVLVLVNTDPKLPRSISFTEETWMELGAPGHDLLKQPIPTLKKQTGRTEMLLEAGGCCCLSERAEPAGLAGNAYRELRAQAAWAITMISRRIRVRDISVFDWREMARLVQAGAKAFLTAVNQLDPALVKDDVLAALKQAMTTDRFVPVVTWDLASRRRVTLVPDDHWLLIEEEAPFRVVLQQEGQHVPEHASSIRIGAVHVVSFAPGRKPGRANLKLERYGEGPSAVDAAMRFIVEPGPESKTAVAPGGITPVIAPDEKTDSQAGHVADAGEALVLLTNGLGGMARLAVDMGRVRSKYDCLLGANLHAALPVDRHIFAKRARIWINADGFITPLDLGNLFEFTTRPVTKWRFVASAGDDRAVEVQLSADMLEGRNVTVLQFHRPQESPPWGRDLGAECRVTLTVRVDIEDRNFHSETQRNSGAEHHFASHTRTLRDETGFEFAPAIDRRLRVFADDGIYHPEPEWSEHVLHPVEATRGQVAQGDAYSPGWFELPLPKGQTVTLVASTEPVDPTAADLKGFIDQRESADLKLLRTAGLKRGDRFGRELALALRAFVVRRDRGKTIIAGYPWFLDWGRDSLICARGLLAAGMADEVQQLLTVFAHFEDRGTLPNTIRGEDASNRDTSDAPLWFGMVCEELAATMNRPRAAAFYATQVDHRGRTVSDVLRSIACGYRDGTPNGIRMDPGSGLVWSPSHFTWMDTNFPAGTPREGYPVEIQALWVRLLRQVAHLAVRGEADEWAAIAQRAEQSMLEKFWLEDRGWISDLLVAAPFVPAREAIVDTSLRSNGLFAVSLGLLTGERARRTVDAALRFLVVPGALRTLAPLPVSPPLPVLGLHRQLLNDPAHPYFGRYEGDEDTRRKPAYHNGTAWTWTFPVFCEALARAWDFSEPAVSAARVYLGSMEQLLHQGCLGQLPEILDGDAPHLQRGCDAQAWGVSEALRVWRLLNA